MGTSHTLTHWNPEDRGFWDGDGHRIAARNLWISVASLTLSFAVWVLWSTVVVYLPAAGFRYSTNQLFWLAALPALSGATLRVVYAFAVPAFGGRRFTALATASLLLPAAGLGVAMLDPATPFEVMVLLALLAGLGGANFAGSMAHINALYPKAQVGWALGVSAGLGHTGVFLAQALVPWVVALPLFGWAGAVHPPGDASALWVHNAGFVWVLPILVTTVVAWFGMNDLANASSDFGEQAVVVRRPDTWRLCWLYLGTFGSFIGFSAAMPLVQHRLFPAEELATLLWSGPLAAALLRPFGGWLSDRQGGARITMACFTLMLAGLAVMAISLPGDASAGWHAGFVVGALLVFAGAGVGSASVFKMIPLVFAALARQPEGSRSRRARASQGRDDIEAAACLGFCSAIGAYGGFVIPKAFGSSLQWTDSPGPALLLFGAFYLSCLGLTWWHYGRHEARTPC
jgi:NNP family nitrate/nitrite transporter-like MFS transporter